MVYQEEKYSDILPELEPLLFKLAEEVDRYPEEPVLDVDHETLSSMDSLQVITAREDGELVGFHVATVQPDIFYKHILTGFVMLYYMLPLFRGRGRGSGLFEYAEKLYKQKEVQRVFMSRKIYIPNEKVFTKLGYKQIEANYTKAIK